MNNITLLQCEKITKKFGGLSALKEIDLTIMSGEILGLIGPNGSGKTTLINIITGVYKPDSGKILYHGEDITKLRPDQICKKGIARTFQIPRPFPQLTALDNVVIGFLFAGSVKKIKIAKKKAMDILEFIGFPPQYYEVKAEKLTTVQIKKLELARALATNPELLLLDEFFAGLTEIEIEEAIELIKRLYEKKITLLVIEHIIRVIMNLCHRIVVLHQGEKIAEGSPREISSNDRVIEAYLGEIYHRGETLS
ncbi:MAG: ABC transporter ATP-binding protein [Candidatus Bathyarchaeia archaeon]